LKSDFLCAKEFCIIGIIDVPTTSIDVIATTIRHSVTFMVLMNVLSFYEKDRTKTNGLVEDMTSIGATK
jgi:hypothetical protein